ncbi:MAG: flagellar biosynthesis anti-sigma factor FlgM [Bryobacterales bacterium]|nr:flagellar biosynthesis anti-sigma factor FlgM [Bryobacterales bacterium]
MKIHNDQLTGLTGAGLSGAERSRATESTPQTGSGRTEQRTADGDRVQLSLLSNSLRAESEDTPERLEKVQALREAYQSGAYQGDSAVVAERLVDEALGGF